MSLPVITAEQRSEALARAAEVRTARKDLRAALKDGSVTLADALADGNAARMKVSALLTALPGVGPVRAAKLMEQHRIAGNRRVAGLGARQKAALEQEFEAASA